VSQQEFEASLFDDILMLVKVNAFSGKFINIDTLDGGGNSTQVSLLAAYLNTRGIPAVQTKEPTEGEYGLAIKRVLRKERNLSPIALQRLFSVDRSDHLDRLIVPTLFGGTWVVTDFRHGSF
jgi:dTMP kinase